jgi:large subunit ribosomal protein L15
MAAFVPLGGGVSVKYTGFRPATCGLPSTSRARVAAARAPVAPTAKMFDWKNRADPDYDKVGGDGIFTLENLRPAPGSKHRKKRKGRGHGAGQGGSCGFGMRGQKSRSGRPSRPGFEGGQTPLYRRVPKFTGRPTGPGHTKTEYALMKIDFLNGCEENSIVTFASLREAGLMTKQKRNLVKVTGGADLSVRGLTVKAHAFTSSAVAAIEGAGGKCVLVSPTTGKDVVVADEE